MMVFMQRERLIQGVMVGGNHLASWLMGKGGKGPAEFDNYEEVLAERGIDYADVWVAWKKIMELRDGEAAAEEEK